MLLLAVALTIIAVLFVVPVIGLYLLGRFLFPEGSTRDYEIDAAAHGSPRLTGAMVWKVWQRWMKEKPQQITSRDQA